MQNSRDSSVWKSLAVAFGDGLAFGVGMKITQSASRASKPAAQTGLNPLALRLEQMEQRIRKIEQQPLALAAPERPAQSFDQKVLEAVVNALDKRLHEQAEQVERRLGELQAKVTMELETLHQQDRSIAGGLESQIDELQKHVGKQLAAVRSIDSDARVNELAEQFSGQMAAIREAAETERRRVEERLAALHGDVTDTLHAQLVAVEQHLREEMESSAGNAGIEARVSELAEQLAGLRGEMGGLLAADPAARLGELQEQLSGQMAAIHATVDAGHRSIEEQAAGHAEISTALAAGIEALRQELHAATYGSAIEARVNELAGQFAGLRAGIESELRESMEQAETVRQQLHEELLESMGTIGTMAASAADAAIEARLAPLRELVAAHDGEVAQQLARMQEQLREEVRQAMSNLAGLAASAADSAIEDRIANLRALVEAKNREIEELRARADGSDQATLELLQGVGDIFRRAAENRTVSAVPAAEPPQSDGEAEGAPAEEQPEASFHELFEAAGGSVEPRPAAASDESAPEPTDTLPGFAHTDTAGRVWRIPLVSTVVLTSGAMLLLRRL